MMTVSKKQLASLAKAIISVANPKAIILFGSQARRTANKHSDIDLLIIGERSFDGTWSRRREIGRIRRSLPPTGLAVDVLFYTPDEVIKWKNTTNHIVSEALQEGKMLYERH